MLVLAASALLVLSCGGFCVKAVISDSKVPFLFSEQGARWIRASEPPTLKARYSADNVSGFRTIFDVGVAGQHPVLHLRVLRGANVQVDGRTVFATSNDLDQWKKRHQIDLGPYLSPGRHELRIMVVNRDGPPCALAYCSELGIVTDERWQASKSGQEWSSALLADSRGACELSRAFPRVDRAFLKIIPLLALVFLCAALATLYSKRVASRFTRFLEPPNLRWILMFAWFALSANNFFKLGLNLGFDARDHVEYVQYLVDHHRIPLAPEGWQLFQSPLYYLLSAPLFAVLKSLAYEDLAVRSLRLIPLLAGLGQIELCHRIMRLVFPRRPDLQSLGILVGGLLPMNLYISQYAGNEAPAGFLSALTILFLFSMTDRPNTSWRAAVLTGAVWGLALLTKATAVLLAAPVMLVLLVVNAREDGRRAGMKRLLIGAAILFGAAFLLSGWYYLRNWLELGRPFIGGWDAARNISWWQDPGYRTPGHFLTFGQALWYPVYSGMWSFWDGIYSTFWADGYLSGIGLLEYAPPWNYSLLLSCMWLALLPSACILLGFVSGFGASEDVSSRGTRIAMFCVLLYGLALFHHFLTNPNYCAAKAFYTVGVTPCYAVLAASGAGLLTRRPAVRALVYGGLACWAVTSYAAYFVV